MGVQGSKAAMVCAWAICLAMFYSYSACPTSAISLLDVSGGANEVLC